MTIRAAALVTLLVGLSALGACSPGGKTADATADRFAGLDGEILKWRTEIVAGDPLCKSQVAGQKCDGFEVACKAERDITPAEQGKGVTAKLVASINFNGWDPRFKSAQISSSTAVFSKSAAGWTHAPHKPVNLTTCADL